MTDPSDLTDAAESLTTALEEGDLPRAAEAAGALAETEAGPEDRLEAFASALQGSDDAEARVLLATLANAYRDRSADERVGRERATTALDTRDLATSAEQALSRHLETAAMTDLERGSVLSLAGSFLAADEPDRDRRDALAEATRDLAERETTFDERRREGEALSSAMDLPAAVDPVATDLRPDRVPSGEAATVAVEVANVGDEPASGVEVALEGDGIDVDPATRSVGTLAGSERTTVTFEAGAGRAGEYDLHVAVTADGLAGGSDEATLDVLEETPPLQAIDESGTGRLSTDELQRAIGLWHRDEPVPGTGGKRLGEDDLWWLIAAWANDLRIGTGVDR